MNDLDLIRDWHIEQGCPKLTAGVHCDLCAALDRLDETLIRYAEGARNSVNFIRDYYDAKAEV